MSKELKLFAVKTCLVAVFTIFAANWIIGGLAETLEDSTARTIANFRAELARTPIGSEQVWGKIERELRAADRSSDLPPEKKQKLINDVRVVIARWRPFIDAAQKELQKPANAN